MLFEIERKNISLIFVILAALTVIAYLPAFNAGYMLDDHILIEKNPAIKNIGNIPLFFISKEARVPKEFSNLQSDIYRPLQSASYAISFMFWGNNPRLFHAENVLIHIINGFLIYLLLYRILKNRPLSFIASALFLIHPVQVEAVTYLAGRADLLSLLFLLIAFLSYMKSAKAISIIAFIVSLFAKEIGACLPFLIIIYLVLIAPRIKEGVSIKRIFKETYPYFLVLAAYFVIRTHDLGRVAQMSARDLPFITLFTVRAFSEYLKLIILPFRLTFYHDLDITSSGIGPAYIIYFFVLIAFLVSCALSINKNKRLAFFLLSYLLALLPVSNIIPIKVIMQERFLYVPSVFIISAIVYLAKDIIINADNAVRDRMILKAAPVLSALLVISTAFTANTFNRNLDWKDQATFMKKEAGLHPLHGLFYFDLGNQNFMEKKYATAITYFEKALEKKLSPIHKTMTYNSLGNCYKEKKDLDRAIEYYEEALNIIPDYVSSINSLGDAYFKKGQYEKAKDFFERALQIWPDSPLFNKNLGTAYIMLGDKEKAFKYWKKSLEFNPNQPDVIKYLSDGQ